MTLSRSTEREALLAEIEGFGISPQLLAFYRAEASLELLREVVADGRAGEAVYRRMGLIPGA